MQKVLIIYTGGTVGMQAMDGGFAPLPNFGDLLNQHIKPTCENSLPDYDFIALSSAIDSANLFPHHWNLMLEIIIEHYESYTGFVVLHGTDTMAYSASALSFALKGLTKPVIFTGSQVPLSEPNNDALSNIIDALKLTQQAPIHEVCICFNGKLLRGNRSCKLNATEFDAFGSPNVPELWNHSNPVTHEVAAHTHLEPNFINPNFLSNAVGILPMYPGMPESVIAALCSNEEVKGIILHSYGVGNLPDQNVFLIEQLTTAVDRGAVILNISQCLQANIQQGHYACSTVLKKLGVISGGDMTLEAGFSKLHFLLATESNLLTLKQKLANNLAGELSHSPFPLSE